MIEIDASIGEGGGQVLRSALALSLALRVPVRLTNIRARRRRPGLAAQHLKAVEAAAAAGGARVEGAALRSQALEFVPGELEGGELSVDIGTAGSTLLVLQTVFVPLGLARSASTLVLTGGTHNSWSPPFPAAALAPLELLERGALRRVRGVSGCAGLEREVAQRQRDAAAARLGRFGVPIAIDLEQVEADSPGTYLVLAAEFERSRIAASALGAPRKRAERVGEEAAEALARAIESGAATDEHLADQLVVPLAFAAGESRVSTARVTSHLLTNVALLDRFLPGAAEVRGAEGAPGELLVRGAGRPAWWNVVVTTGQGRPRFFAALRGLRRLGDFRPSAFRDVCLGRVADAEAFLASLAAAKAANESWAAAVSRAVVLERSFAFTPPTLAAQLETAAAPLAARMTGGSFHFRLERRGLAASVPSHAIEREVADRLYARAEARGARLRTDFSDPDYVLLAETAGAECGVALLPRALRERFPFVAAR